MNDNRLRDVLKALRCCRDDLCTRCPLQGEICDVLDVPTEPVPVELLDRIEEELEAMYKIRKIGSNMNK